MVNFTQIIFIGIAALVALVMFSPDQSDSLLQFDIKVIERDEEVERFLKKYKKTIGEKDYEGYKGHIYRVLTYAMHFLDGDETNQSLIGIALVFHDLGLWTDNTLTYLEPSCKRAKEAMKKANYSPNDINLVQDIIYWHHKFTPYESEIDMNDGSFSSYAKRASTSSINDKIINAVRKADWIDATYGLIRNGMPKRHVQLVQQTIPNKGFHQTLLNFGPKLYGYNVYSIVTGLASIFRY